MSLASSKKSTFLKFYLAVPFLVEIKLFIEWVFKDTSLTLDQWLHLHYIDLHVANINLPPQGSSQSTKIRLSQIIRGILIFYGLCAFLTILSAPLVFFSTYGLWAPSQYELQSKASFSLSIGENTFPLFQVDEQFHAESFKAKELPLSYSRYLSSVDSSSLKDIVLRPFANSPWDIPEDRYQFLKVKLQEVISRLENGEGVRSVNASSPIIINMRYSNRQLPTRLTSEVFEEKAISYILFNTTSASSAILLAKTLLNITKCTGNTIRLSHFYDPLIITSAIFEEKKDYLDVDIRTDCTIQWDKKTEPIASYVYWEIQTDALVDSYYGGVTGLQILTSIKFPHYLIRLSIQFSYIAFLLTVGHLWRRWKLGFLSKKTLRDSKIANELAKICQEIFSAQLSNLFTKEAKLYSRMDAFFKSL